MPTLTKLIFGVHSTWQSVTLHVDGDPANTETQLTVLQRDEDPVSVPYSSSHGGWIVALTEADYILKIEVEDTDWFDGAINIAVVDQTDVTFVFHGPETPPPNAHQTLAWTDNVASTGNDPKDPWPPPGTVTTNLPGSSFDWFEDNLHTARLSVSTPKAA